MKRAIHGTRIINAEEPRQILQPRMIEQRKKCLSTPAVKAADHGVVLSGRRPTEVLSLSRAGVSSTCLNSEARCSYTAAQIHLRP